MPAGNAHRLLSTMYDAYTPDVGAGFLKDPGASGTMTPTMWGQYCPVVTLTAESRTLARPTRVGILFTVVLDTDAGDATLAVTGGYNTDDDTAIVFADAGDMVVFLSMKEGTTYFWRAIRSEGTDAAVEEGIFDTLTVSGTAALTGVATPIGGLAPAGGTTIVLARPGAVCHTGGVVAKSTADGFNATAVITEIYYSEVFVPCNMSVTGISVFNGSVASDAWHFALLDADGALVTGSATGAKTSSGTDAYQRMAFSGGAITVLGPATYYVAAICNGTTDRYNAHGIGGVVTTGVELNLSAVMVAGKITSQTYGAIPATNALTLTWVTDLGRIASLY